MSKKEQLPSFKQRHEMPLNEARSLIPSNYENCWLTKDILEGKFHAPDHPTIVLGLLEKLGNMALERGINVDLDALKITALYHDTQRAKENEDLGHETRGAEFIRLLVKEGKIQPGRNAEIAAEVCEQHNKRTKDVVMDGNINLRLFKLCDYIARVRYESPEFEVTVEHLQDIMPNVFTDTELESVILQARCITSLVNKFREQGISPKDSALEAGKITNLFR